jgi:AraC-like DNA-binding protein
MLKQTDDYSSRGFHAASFPEAQRFGVWHEVVNDWLLEAELRQVGGGIFRGSALLRVLPDVRFGWGALDGTIGRRTRSIVSQDNDDVFLFVNCGGTFTALRGGEEVEVKPGGAYLTSCADAGVYRWPEGMRLIALRARQDAIASLVRNVHDHIGRAIPVDNQGLRLLVRYLRLFDETESLDDPAACALVTQHVHDLLALALGGAGDGREFADTRSGRAARLKAIKAHVDANLERHDLSPATVARAFQVAPRTVQRLFEMDGTSFTEFVLERRLARAYAALGGQHGGSRGIADIALASGFNNISYFNRRFHARYGATPSDIRHARRM